MTPGDARRAKLLAEAERYNFELAMARDYATAHGFPEPNSPTWDYLTMGCQYRNSEDRNRYLGLCGCPPVGELGGQRRCGKHMASGRHP